MDLETQPTLWERIVYAATGDFPASWYRREAEREAAQYEAMRNLMEQGLAAGRWTHTTGRSGIESWRRAVAERGASNYRDDR